MSVVKHQSSGDRVVLEISGRFDFQIHREFRNSYQTLLSEAGLKKIELDFKRVDYIDSSGLGMLLLLRERAMDKAIEIIISRPSSMVAQMFEVASFGRLFKLI